MQSVASSNLEASCGKSQQPWEVFFERGWGPSAGRVIWVPPAPPLVPDYAARPSSVTTVRTGRLFRTTPGPIRQNGGSTQEGRTARLSRCAGRKNPQSRQRLKSTTLPIKKTKSVFWRSMTDRITVSVWF